MMDWEEKGQTRKMNNKISKWEHRKTNKGLNEQNYRGYGVALRGSEIMQKRQSSLI